MSFAFIHPENVSAKRTLVAAATTTNSTVSLVEEKMGLYDSLDLDDKGLSKKAFEYALTGYNRLLSSGRIVKDNILSILDFSLPSGKKRLFVIDLATGQLLFNTYAAHGRNSGADMATRFSNKNNSHQSSLGFYITGTIYTGKHGESLRLMGEEKGFNDNAFARGIVMHSAAYADEEIVARQGFIGRSQGCPALPQNISKEIIGKIKDGSCLFLYSPDTYYTSHSQLING
ncbi:murein L,D-transpeptidase catalytic domain family protein [Sediminibacterium soli]|uniref:murein L,D-transpeptidase catalytic domain family protein n=1 Tax=Sediminibacterium soli TaxID=2698829 RepID=UPI001F35D3EB|nr:murein L,D-transpeptidase catalytic domain family protein [Sediminibacterium soli]